MKRKTNEPRVPYAEAIRRVRAGFKGPVFNISIFADLIWPHNRMARQGAALAVGHLVRRMEQDGVIFRIVTRGRGVEAGRGGWELNRTGKT